MLNTYKQNLISILILSCLDFSTDYFKLLPALILDCNFYGNLSHLYKQRCYLEYFISLFKRLTTKMKAAIFSLSFLLATFAKADTTVSAAASTSTCAADYIVETCLSSEEAIQEACGQQDYTCQCAAYQSIVT